MKIGDRCFVHGYIDEIRKDTVIIKNKGGYFGTDPGEVIVVNDTAHPNWIPVSERLPETDDEVLVTYTVNGKKQRYVETATWYDGDEGCWSSPWDEYRIPGTKVDVIAWMPLPEPWKGEHHETD